MNFFYCFFEKGRILDFGGKPHTMGITEISKRSSRALKHPKKCSNSTAVEVVSQTAWKSEQKPGKARLVDTLINRACLKNGVSKTEQYL
jgi:hypothetical protein